MVFNIDYCHKFMDYTYEQLFVISHRCKGIDFIFESDTTNNFASEFDGRTIDNFLIGKFSKIWSSSIRTAFISVTFLPTMMTTFSILPSSEKLKDLNYWNYLYLVLVIIAPSILKINKCSRIAFSFTLSSYILSWYQISKVLDMESF